MTILEVPVRDGYTKVPLKKVLKDLLLTLWREGEMFNAKRPFGDSYWQHHVYQALAENHFIKATFDEDGYVDDFDVNDADAVIEDAIHQLFGEEE